MLDAFQSAGSHWVIVFCPHMFDLCSLVSLYLKCAHECMCESPGVTRAHTFFTGVEVQVLA